MTIQDLSQSTVLHKRSLQRGLEKLEKSVTKIIFVVDESGRLMGTCTDGDFRRAILRGAELDDPVLSVANRDPFMVVEGTLVDLEASLAAHDIDYAPLVDGDGLLLGMVGKDRMPKPSDRPEPVVLMAGGLGQRLMPLTKDCPKPLLQLGDRPMLEHIILRFREQGFRRFFVSLGYLGHMIEDYFGNGDQLGVQMSYLREDKRLGTAGALSLMPSNIKQNIIVMNSDLITDMDFDDLVIHHARSSAAATMCIREHRTNIAFGVVDTQGTRYIETREKPTLTHHINAGIYCISPDALRLVPEDKFYDMPSLFKDLVNQKYDCEVHLMRDTWHDIGSTHDFNAAQVKFASGMTNPVKIPSGHTQALTEASAI